MPRTVAAAELLQMTGHTSEPSPWLRVDQARIDLFAEATGDRQFIHVDPARAAATPFGTTIAHGFLSLSLLPLLAEDIAVVPAGLAMAVNYGLNKVRFIQPVKEGSRVRLRAKILDVGEKLPGRIMLTSESTVEIEGERRPALIAETITLFVLK